MDAVCRYLEDWDAVTVLQSPSLERHREDRARNRIAK